MRFYDWLINQNRSPKTAKNYSNALSGKLSDHATLIQDGRIDHKQLQSDAGFKAYCANNDSTGELYELNKRGKGMYRRALVMYVEYVVSISSSDVINDFEGRVIKSKKDSQENRRKRLESSPRRPTKISATIEVFDRNPDVVAEVLARADGFCESCKEAAPFIRKSDNTPYLEVHHKLPLAQGGDDTVENAEALCPNCHRERHYGV